MTDTGKEYAEALFTLASEEERGKEYSDALTTLAGLLRENPDYTELLSSPCIPLNERREAIDAAFSGGVWDTIASFLKLLCEHGRIPEIFEIIDGYQELYKFASGISTAFITSAVELTGEEKSALREKLEKKLSHKVELVCGVDASLIGGVRISVDGMVMDGSIRSKLTDIRELIK